MKDIVLQLGFVFSHKGCPCNGTPDVYKCTHNGGKYTLTVWEKRRVWRLEVQGCQLGMGSDKNLLTKLQTLWA